MEPANVRNLEQIQERDLGRRSNRFAALLMASGAGAALVVAFVMVSSRGAPPTESEHDPLGELLRSAKATEMAPETLGREEVSFPGLLSDDAQPTTAMAAVKDERGRFIAGGEGEPGAGAPPPPTDQLPVVPLPAGDLLNATPVTTDPGDALTRMAHAVSASDDAAELAPEGFDAGYQIQVASFKEQADADTFVEELRRRGHGAFRKTAQVPGRGLWHRVRVGPFKTKYEANLYKQKFEKSERVSPFVVDPDKVRQAEEVRSAKLAARIKKYGRP
jgi:cell division septation protein DedD